MAQTVIISHLGISLGMLRRLVALVQDTKVKYDQVDGGRCPACRTPRARVSWSKPPLRNHRCRICGTRFQSIEHPIFDD